MSVIINASVSQGLVMTSDLSGNLQFQNNGVNLPMGGVAPAFSAYQSTLQALSASTATKIQFQTEEFDTNNNFDSTTNYRFTPTVAGYYQVSAGIAVATTPCNVDLRVYKNGTFYKILGPNSVTVGESQGSCLVSLNGSTDYIEIYALFSTAQNTFANSANTYFQACLVRGA
jgi:hypothetical protein